MCDSLDPFGDSMTAPEHMSRIAVEHTSVSFMSLPYPFSLQEASACKWRQIFHLPIAEKLR
jgi:hypothetical protein